MKAKSGNFFKIIAFLLCFLLCFEQFLPAGRQAAFAQIAGQLDISGHLAAFRNTLISDTFRPLHLRYLQYNSLNNSFQLFLDKGDSKNPRTQELENTSKELLKYFFIGISLPNDSFWVNLRPDAEDNIIDDYLARTDIGKIMLESDLQLKKDTALATSPETPEGKKYWDKLYKKAGEIFGSENITIPTLTRPWIVPDEIIIRETADSVYIYKATLKVMLEQDYLKDSAVYNFKDDRLKDLNEYSSQLIREIILPKLTKEINSSKRYASLRQVYYSLIMAQWFKARFRPSSLRASPAGASKAISNLINSRNLTNLTSKESWSKTTYFKEYQKSFKDGEYNIQEPVYTPYAQTIRSYFSGGISGIAPAIPKLGTTFTDPKTKTTSSSIVGLTPPSLNNNVVIGVRAQATDTTGEVEKVELLTLKPEREQPSIASSPAEAAGEISITWEMIRDWNRRIRAAQDALSKGDFVTALIIYKGMRQLRLDSNTKDSLLRLASSINYVIEQLYEEDKLDLDSLLMRPDIEEATGEIIQNGVVRGAESGVELNTKLDAGYKVRLGQYGATAVGQQSDYVQYSTRPKLFLVMHWHPSNGDAAYGFINLSDPDINYNPENRWVMAIWGTEFDNIGFYATVYDKKTKETKFYSLLPESYNLPISFRKSQGYRFYPIGEKKAKDIEQKIQTNMSEISKDRINKIFRESYAETETKYRGKTKILAEAENEIRELIEDRVIEIENLEGNKIKEKGFFRWLHKKRAGDYKFDFYARNEDFRQRLILAGRLHALFAIRKADQGKEGQSKDKQIDSWQDFFNRDMPWYLSEIFGWPKGREHPIPEEIASSPAQEPMNAANPAQASSPAAAQDEASAQVDRKLIEVNEALQRIVDYLKSGAIVIFGDMHRGERRPQDDEVWDHELFLDYVEQLGEFSMNFSVALELPYQLEAKVNDPSVSAEDFLDEYYKLLAAKDSVELATSDSEIRRPYLSRLLRTLKRFNIPVILIDDINSQRKGGLFTDIDVIEQSNKDMAQKLLVGRKKHSKDSILLMVGRTHVVPKISSIWLGGREMNSMPRVLRDSADIIKLVRPDDVQYDEEDLANFDLIIKVDGKRQKEYLVRQGVLGPEDAAVSSGVSEKGGIDFRSLPIVTQAVTNLSTSISSSAIHNLISINLDEEWLEIERMASSGITPSSERIKEYIQTSCAQDNITQDRDKILLCISDILRLEEERYSPTDPLLRDILVMLDSVRQPQELTQVFLGKTDF